MEGTDQETTAPTNPQTNANGDNDDEMKQDEIKKVQVEAVDNKEITPEDETTSPTTLTNEDDMGTTTATTAMEASMENPSNVDKDTPMNHDDLIDEDEMDDPDQIATAQQTSRQLNEQALFHQMESNYIAVKTERSHLLPFS